jgi:hypothetical protein
MQIKIRYQEAATHGKAAKRAGKYEAALSDPSALINYPRLLFFTSL